MIPGENTRVRRLSPTLANQIAAGEVIERPASVIKELLENAVDAGATRLDIDVEQGGIGLIKVRDDGHGIHADDLVLALSRHATSKVSSLEDLQAVSSLGFRGEALSSMASVARVELRSRTAAETHAWQVAVDGTEVNNQPLPCSHPVGTTVTVRELFFNTPARRKFLRTEKTELKHIEDVVKRVALSRFDIEVRLRHNERPIWSLPKSDTEQASLRRLTKLCGRAFCEHALRIDLEAGDMRLAGWLGLPGFARRQGDLQYFFLNGRMVRDRVVTHAIRQAYETDLGAGDHPAFVLYLEMDPGRVDVNVHPAKHEVRFRDSRSVHDFLFRTLNRVLSEHGDPSLTLENDVEPGGSTVKEQLAVYRKLSRPGEDRPPVEDTGWLGSPLTVIGESFLITESGQFLIVIDLVQARYHIAHLRMTRDETSGEVRSRPLLVPVTQRVTQTQATLIETEEEKLRAVGIDLRRVGPERVALRRIPIALEQTDPARLISAVIDHLSATVQDQEVFHAKLAMCTAQSDWAHDPVSLTRLLRTLEAHDVHPHCPPVCYRLGASELSRLLRDRGG